MHAYVCFQGCLANRDNLRSLQNLENVCNELVERWHFRMLNDDIRNDRYQKAIGNAIGINECRNPNFRVLDIGTGTGLLAIYAAQEGCKSIVAVDDCPQMAMIARHVFETTSYCEQIDLLDIYSTFLMPELVGGQFDLIVTETLDSGAFGEGILKTLIHAKECLLKENGKILPQKVTLYIAGYRSTQMTMDHLCLNESFTDMIYLKGCSMVSNTSDPYDTENVRLVSDFKLVTSTEEAFSCDFNDLDDMKFIEQGAKEAKVKLTVIHTGYLDGFAIWFDVDVDETNRISSSPSHRSCWDTVVFRLSHRFIITASRPELNVTVSCPAGRLTLVHDYNYTGHVISVKQDIIRFINDFEYIDQLEHEFFSSGQRISVSNRASYANILDFSPFPYVGICLMKEQRATKLYCDRSVQEFVEFVASQNAVDLDKIVFLENPTDSLSISDMFDIIILSPLNTMGCVNSSQVSNYGYLKENKLTPGGRMLPHAIEVWGELVQSHYLNEVCFVSNPVLEALGIQSAINKFATYHQMNLQTFPHTSCSSPFLCAELQLNDELYEQTVSVMGSSPGRLESDGILYYFQIRLTPGECPVSTRRIMSHIRRACLLWDPKRMELGDRRRTANPLIVRYVQQHGVIYFNL